MTSVNQPADDLDLIEQIQRDAAAGVEAGDVDRLMAMFDEGDGSFTFDYSPPRASTTPKLRQNFVSLISEMDGPITCAYREIHPQLLSADAAWSWAIMHVGFRVKGGHAIDLVVRVTDVWRKLNGRWRAIHEHASFPVDVMTGRADLHSKMAEETTS